MCGTRIARRVHRKPVRSACESAYAPPPSQNPRRSNQLNTDRVSRHRGAAMILVAPPRRVCIAWVRVRSEPKMTGKNLLDKEQSSVAKF
ncbi:unnamed protein product [Mycena citricolor]|uniref:Uncharacterized protein n=1 Tax=Mycena citricolor TaxID=2018698 RepID=A0AAD2JUP9_9AGAR|nr:unnamed protein product [Mycena citricolor]